MMLDTGAAESETGHIIYQICDALAVCLLTCVVGDGRG